MRQPPQNLKEKGTCPKITLRCPIKAGEGRLFVKASAIILCVRRGISLIIPALTNSRTKHRRISMCRENFRRTGFSLRAIQAKLSSKMSVSKIAQCFAQIHYFLGCLAGCDKSASEVEKETLSCRRLFQEMGPPFIIKM